MVCAATGPLGDDFTNPPAEYKGRPFFQWYGNTINPTDTSNFMNIYRNTDDYGGITIIPYSSTVPSYFSTDYLTQYGYALDKVDQLGMKVILYEDSGFPTGTIQGRLQASYPQYVAKRLDVAVNNVTGPLTSYQMNGPSGTKIGAVAMSMGTYARTNISSYVSGNTLTWNVPSGSYRIMIFSLVDNAAGNGIVNPLDPTACQQYKNMGPETYYTNFASHFNTTIDYSFFDDMSFEHVTDSRMWSNNINAKFQEMFPGQDPLLCYPALFYNIGADTVSARNKLFTVRSELLANGYPKTMADWASSHNIKSGGHVSQDYENYSLIASINDYMKFFKNVTVPAYDEIFYPRHNLSKMKIVSSSAYNYDRPVVMGESFGAFKTWGYDVTSDLLYKETLEQFTKGLSLMIPHAVWYNPNSQPFADTELSSRNANLSGVFGPFNKFIGRLSRLMQGGRHIADIGVLYPAASIQGKYFFGSANGIVDYLDYIDVGETLSTGIRRDFTFIHPEILDSRCTVSGSNINLNNTVNYEQYKVFVIPGSNSISWSNLQKIKQFYDNGGSVVGTTILPYKATDSTSNDSNVRTTIKSIFNLDPKVYSQVDAALFDVNPILKSVMTIREVILAGR